MASVLTRSLAVAGIMMITAVGALDAQMIPRPEARRLPNWIGAGIGIVQGYGLDDGISRSSWQFGSNLEYAARFEHPTGNGILVGAQLTYSDASLTYFSNSGSGPCQSGCDASATVMQLMGVARYGHGYTFHPIYELGVGVIGYSNFREVSTNARLQPSSIDYDMRVSLGYGFGLGISSNFALELLQEIGTVLHQKTDLPASSNNYPRVYVTRIGGKITF